MRLSKEALDALVNASNGSGRIPATTPGSVAAELVRHGLIGVASGMTRRGRIVREREIMRRLDEAF